MGAEGAQISGDDTNAVSGTWREGSKRQSGRAQQDWMGRSLNARLGNLGCVLYTMVTQAEILQNPREGRRHVIWIFLEMII